MDRSIPSFENKVLMLEDILRFFDVLEKDILDADPDKLTQDLTTDMLNISNEYGQVINKWTQNEYDDLINFRAKILNFDYKIKKIIPKEKLMALNIGDSPRSVEVPSGSPRSVEVPSGSPRSVEVPSGSPRSVEVPSGSQQGIEVPPGSPRNVVISEDSQQGIEVPLGSPRGVEIPEIYQQGIEVPLGSQQGFEFPLGSQQETRETMIEKIKSIYQVFDDLVFNFQENYSGNNNLLDSIIYTSYRYFTFFGRGGSVDDASYEDLVGLYEIIQDTIEKINLEETRQDKARKAENISEIDKDVNNPEDTGEEEKISPVINNPKGKGIILPGVTPKLEWKHSNVRETIYFIGVLGLIASLIYFITKILFPKKNIRGGGDDVLSKWNNFTKNLNFNSVIKMIKNQDTGLIRKIKLLENRLIEIIITTLNKSKMYDLIPDFIYGILFESKKKIPETLNRIGEKIQYQKLSKSAVFYLRENFNSIMNGFFRMIGKD